MGRHAAITRARNLVPLMDDLKAIKLIEVAFREDERFATSGFRIGDVVWDNNFGSTHQEPRNPKPNSSENTVEDKNYLLDFQRGRLLDFNTIEPVRYQNAMMDGENRRRSPIANDNVTEMRWGVQRQYGSTLIFKAFGSTR